MPDVDVPDAPLDTPDDPDTPPDAIDLSQLRAELLQKIDASSCPNEPCPLISFTAQPSTALDSSRGKRILLIDDATVLQAVTRWPARVIGLLAIGSDGSYTDTIPEFTLPKEALDVLTTITAFPHPVSSERLDIAAEFFTRFADSLPADAFGHGMDILPFLAERISDSQFVLSADQMDAPTPCALLNAGPGDALWTAHDAFVARMSQTLATAIVDHGINYVHLSWGFGHSELSRTFQSRCGRSASVATTRRFMEPYVTLLGSLTALSTPGANGALRPVVVFQAGAAGVDPDARRLDCAVIAGRVRVFSVPYIGTAVPLQGSHDTSLLLPLSFADLACNDVFVVMGYTSVFRPTRADKFFPSMLFGVGRAPRPSWPPTSSFANPIALAHFVHIGEDHPNESTGDWISRLTGGGTQLIIDPLLHDPKLLPAGP